MIILHRIDPRRCMYRWYSVDIYPTLFEPWTVVCAWGSLRNNFQRRRAIPCENEEAARRLAAEIIARKEKRGYKRKGHTKSADSLDSPQSLL